MNHLNRTEDCVAENHTFSFENMRTPFATSMNASF